MPKRKVISRDKCDELEWLVDIFGSPDILSSVISDYPNVLKPFIVANLEAREVKNDNGDSINLPPTAFQRLKKSDVKSGVVPNGVYFVGGHWYSVKNNNALNSYKLDFQKKGTAHFCQTFAAIIYLDLYKTKYKLYPHEYSKNIYTALQFWVDILKDPDNENLTVFIIDEIRKWNLDDPSIPYNSKSVNLITNDKPLTKITKQTLLQFMKYLQEYALDNAYGHCKQG